VGLERRFRHDQWSKGRNSTVPQTVVEADTTLKGQLLSAVTYVSVLVLVLVVYVVERTKQ